MIWKGTSRRGMTEKRMALTLVLFLLLSLPSLTAQAEDTVLVDAFGDGWSNSADAYPEDATKHEAGLLSGNLLTVGVPIIVVIVLLLLMLGRRRGPSAEQALLPALPSAPGLPVAAPPQTGPPLPPQGLPPGWTMEQWAWYGEDYLNNR